MSLLYVMHEHPSVSQSFVVNEAAAVAALGVPVHGYALKPGMASRPAAEIPMIARPPGGARLAFAAIRSLPIVLPRLRSASGFERRELARSVLAEAHALVALSGARKAGVTHVHAHFLGRPAHVAAALARRLGCGWSATAHGDDVYLPAEPGMLTTHLRTVAAVACASEDVRRHLEAHARDAGVEVETAIVHCGIDTGAIRFAPAAAGSSPRLVTIGRMVETKGYRTAFAAISELMREVSQLRWTVIGDGPLRAELEGDAAREGSRGVEFLGSRNHDEALALLSGADGFVLPCEQGRAGESDGIPVVLMEAMAAGVPVVTSPVGGITELVEDGKCGYLVPSKDPAALAATLRKVLDPGHRETMKRICAEARVKVERQFDQNAEARALLDLLSPHL